MPTPCSRCSEPVNTGLICATCILTEDDEIVNDAVDRLESRPTGASELQRELDFQFGQLTGLQGLSLQQVGQRVETMVNHVAQVVMRMWPGMSVTPFCPEKDIWVSPTSRAMHAQVVYEMAPMRQRKFLYYSLKVSE